MYNSAWHNYSLASGCLVNEKYYSAVLSPSVSADLPPQRVNHCNDGCICNSSKGSNGDLIADVPFLLSLNSMYHSHWQLFDAEEP